MLTTWNFWWLLHCYSIYPLFLPLVNTEAKANMKANIYINNDLSIICWLFALFCHFLTKDLCFWCFHIFESIISLKVFELEFMVCCLLVPNIEPAMPIHFPQVLNRWYCELPRDLGTKATEEGKEIKNNGKIKKKKEGKENRTQHHSSCQILTFELNGYKKQNGRKNITENIVLEKRKKSRRQKKKT